MKYLSWMKDTSKKVWRRSSDKPGKDNVSDVLPKTQPDHFPSLGVGETQGVIELCCNCMFVLIASCRPGSETNFKSIDM